MLQILHLRMLLSCRSGCLATMFLSAAWAFAAHHGDPNYAGPEKDMGKPWEVGPAFRERPDAYS